LQYFNELALSSASAWPSAALALGRQRRGPGMMLDGNEDAQRSRRYHIF
jgi:hypothetical protein